MSNYKRAAGAMVVLAILALVGWFLFLPTIVSQQVQETEIPNAAESNQQIRFDINDTEQHELDEVLAESPKIEKIFQLGQAANKDISFYGKVVDQHGEPVQGAKVSYQIPTYGLGLGPSVKNLSRETDEAGMFILERESGTELVMKSIEKPGYSFEKLWGKNFSYSARTVADKPFTPDPDNPVVFHAWKKGYAARNLKTGGGFITPKAGDVRVLRFPETEGTVSIRFVHHEPENAEENDGRRRWTAYVVVERGGILETEDRFMYEAPESGYQSEWQVTGKEDQWIKKRFCLKALNGLVYARIETEMSGYYGEADDRGAIDIKYALNPTGSRNLLSEKD